MVWSSCLCEAIDVLACNDDAATVVLHDAYPTRFAAPPGGLMLSIAPYVKYSSALAVHELIGARSEGVAYI